jgi:(S)-ureidoglycine aminohydrolase
MSEPIKLTSLSTTVVRANHALITGDGFVNSSVPNWSDCTVNVIINEAMGANFAQLRTLLTEASTLEGKAKQTQIFFFVVDGECTFEIGSKSTHLTKGGYAYIPIGHDYKISEGKDGTELLSFHKKYEALEGFEVPSPVMGYDKDHEQFIYENDPGLLMRNLLPDQQDKSFDMAVNIFTYMPGANLPFVETHIMEHGLLYLEGQGIYRLDDSWYPVRKGDAIWMAPYCPQWFGALGTEPAIYIYYKDVNRHPITP